MILKVSHDTLYTYENAVYIQPQYLHFYPQHREYLELINWEIKVTPEPSARSHRLDAENNVMIQCLFNQKLKELKIEALLEVHVKPYNPFNFFIDESVTKRADEQPVLMPYLTTVEKLSPKLQSWIEKEISPLENDPVSILSKLNQRIHEKWSHAPRYIEDLLSPVQCFDRKEGSCRDLSWMLIHFLRFLEIPSRFVSGYAFNEELGEGHELHAWVEAWLPGAGWVGIDPSAGMWTTETYIPIVTSYEPSRTMPVSGNYRGDARSELSTKVAIEAIDK